MHPVSQWDSEGAQGLEAMCVQGVGGGCCTDRGWGQWRRPYLARAWCIYYCGPLSETFGEHWTGLQWGQLLRVGRHT